VKFLGIKYYATVRPSMQQDILAKLEQRLGRVHARQRLGIEKDYEQRVFGHGINFFHIENWYSIHSVIRNSLKLIFTGSA
jgi:uncharacterized protein